MQDNESMAFRIGNRIFAIQTADGGYDYTIYHENYRLIDGGILDAPDKNIYEAAAEVLAGEEWPFQGADLTGEQRVTAAAAMLSNAPVMPYPYDFDEALAP
ncbi:hypothetical protein SDC9_107507 [bioreactor metagenome]|uniref:Large polyvalent protein-associated domain-containing protein n=1 Tax=bioreactor metagenome TaxID=1076179 RepID=A0A645B5E7_9ZZZZ